MRIVPSAVNHLHRRFVRSSKRGGLESDTLYTNVDVYLVILGGCLKV